MTLIRETGACYLYDKNNPAAWAIKREDYNDAYAAWKRKDPDFECVNYWGSILHLDMSSVYAVLLTSPESEEASHAHVKRSEREDIL